MHPFHALSPRPTKPTRPTGKDQKEIHHHTRQKSSTHPPKSPSPKHIPTPNKQPTQSLQLSILYPLTSPSIRSFSRSILHSVYISIVARMAARWPGPVLPGRASAWWRHIPVSRLLVGTVAITPPARCACVVVAPSSQQHARFAKIWGKGESVQVARFRPSASGTPNQYFSSPPLFVASAWEAWSSSPRWMRLVLGGMRERKTTM